MTVKRNALGRGLSALIPANTPAESAGPISDFFQCPIEKIEPNRTQPRQSFDEASLEALTNSIREQGVIQPLIVRPRLDGIYELVAGERRWRAAQRAGLREVPAIIRTLTDQEGMEIALVENLQREDLNPVEEAEAYRLLMDEHAYTHDALATRLGRDRTTITNSLRLLKLPFSVRQALIDGRISAGHARALLGIEDEAVCVRLLKDIVSKQLSVRQVETQVKQLRNPSESKQKPDRSPNLRDLEERLGRSLKTSVRVVETAQNKGHVQISYNSLDEFDHLLEVLLR